MSDTKKNEAHSQLLEDEQVEEVSGGKITPADHDKLHLKFASVLDSDNSKFALADIIDP